MANLPESSVFDLGVYQIETTDPVIGGTSGVSNKAATNLANRTKYLKDHVDAIEAAYAPKASPTFTGVPAAPTAAAGTNTTQLATTAFVTGAIATSATPLNSTAATVAMNGTQAAGSSTSAARADHVHPTDTSRAPIASPALTGTPTTPTAATGTNNSQIASTQFVISQIASSATPVAHVGSGGSAHAAATPTADGFLTAADKTKLDGIDSAVSANVVKPGTLIMFAGSTPPAGYIACPVAVTNVSRATYAALFAAIGTTWGAGDGSSTFGLPYFPDGYAAVSGPPGTTTAGEVIAHSHQYFHTNVGNSSTPGGAYWSINYSGYTDNTSVTGGAANKAAGANVKFAVKF